MVDVLTEGNNMTEFEMWMQLLGMVCYILLMLFIWKWCGKFGEWFASLF